MEAATLTAVATPSRSARCRNAVLWAIAAVSVAWALMSGTLIHNIVEQVQQVVIFAVLIVLTEILFVVGLALEAIAAGRVIFSSWKPGAIYSSITSFKLSELGRSFSNSRLAWFGFYINYVGALGTGIVLALGIVVVLPPQSWGLLGLAVADIGLTFLRCIPQKQIMEAHTGKLVLRSGKPNDLESYLNAQQSSWGEEMAADVAKLRSRFQVFPQGVVVAVSHGKVVALVTTIYIPYYKREEKPVWTTWSKISADGWCTTHAPHGKIMYGVDMSASADAPRGIHDQLLIRCMHRVVRDNLQCGMLGGRMPGYSQYCHMMSAEQYVNAKGEDGKLLDSQVRMYTSVPGLAVEGVLPDYFDDPASCNYGVLLVWKNPFYNWSGRAFWAWLVVTSVSMESSWRKLQRRFR